MSGDEKFVDVASVQASALQEAADRVGPELANEAGGHTSTYSVRRWLHARADALTGGDA